MRLGPKPRAASSAAIAVGVLPSPLKTKRRVPACRCAFSIASGRPTSEIVATSCNGQPRRAAASDSDDGAGSTRSSSAGSCRASVAPTPNNIGSPLASTHTDAAPSRCASTGATSNGRGHVSRRARRRAGSIARWRSPPKTTAASSNARRAGRPSPAKPSSPIPTTVSHAGMRPSSFFNPDLTAAARQSRPQRTYTVRKKA